MLSGGTPSKSERAYWGGPIPWLTPKDMGQWTGSTENTVTLKAIGNGTRLAPEDAIFIAVRGMSLHKEIRIIRSSTALAFNQDIKAIVPKDGVNGRFLYYALIAKKNELLGSVEAAGHGTGRLPTDKLCSLSIPQTSQLNQQAIANLLSQLDDKIELNRQMNETLEATARLFFKDWFVDFGPTRAKAEGQPPYLAAELWELFPDALDADDKPMGWREGTLADIARLNPDVWGSKNTPLSIEYVDLANTKWGEIEQTQVFAWDKAPSRARRILNPGDTIIGTVRPGNGSFALVGKSGLTGSTGFAVLRPQRPECREAIYISATSPETIETLSHLADGAAYPAVRPEVVASQPIIVPGHNCLEAFSRLTAPLIDAMLANRQESRTLSQTRDLFLPKLMSGEIRLRDAERLVEQVA